MNGFCNVEKGMRLQKIYIGGLLSIVILLEILRISILHICRLVILLLVGLSLQLVRLVSLLEPQLVSSLYMPWLSRGVTLKALLGNTNMSLMGLPKSLGTDIRLTL